MSTNRRKIRGKISAICQKISFSLSIVTLHETHVNAREEHFLHQALSRQIENRVESHNVRILRESVCTVYKTLKWYEFKNAKLPPHLKHAYLTAGIHR